MAKKKKPELRQPIDSKPRQPIDSTTFSILCFLSDTENTASGLRSLLETMTHVGISRSPMYRRMRILVSSGLVTEEVRDGNDGNLFHLTKKGKKIVLDWAGTFQMLAALASYTLEYVGSKEYEGETK